VRRVALGQVEQRPPVPQARCIEEVREGGGEVDRGAVLILEDGGARHQLQPDLEGHPDRGTPQRRGGDPREAPLTLHIRHPGQGA
jgi:hypothetical protein